MLPLLLVVPLPSHRGPGNACLLLKLLPLLLALLLLQAHCL
jgi:hypothetical protein